MTWNPWTELPVLAQPNANLAVLSRLPNLLDVFVVGTDGVVRSTWKFDGEAWASWFAVGSLRLPSGASIRAVARIPDAIDLFAIGMDGIPVTCSWSPATNWLDWRPIPGVAAPAGAPVEAVARRSDHLDLFLVANDGQLWSTWWHLGDPGWAPWFPIEGAGFAPGAPAAAVARLPNHLDVFVVGADGFVRSSWWHEGVFHPGRTWAPWFQIGEAPFLPAGTLAAVARMSTHLDLFGIGVDGRTYSTWWHQGESWAPWFVIGDTTFSPSARLIALSRDANHLDLFAVRNRLYATWWKHGLFHRGRPWTPWFPVAGSPTSLEPDVLAAVQRPGSTRADVLVARGGGGVVHDSGGGTRSFGIGIVATTGNRLPVAHESKNWAENVTLHTYRFEEPRSLAEVRNLVRDAENQRKRVRVVGSKWSQTDAVECEDILVDLRNMRRVLGLAQGGTLFRGNSAVLRSAVTDPVVAAGTRLAHVEAGIRIIDLYLALDKKDGFGGDRARARWALPTMGGAGGQTVAGLISTSSHGSNFRRPPLGEFLRAIELVGPGGEVHWIEPGSRPITDRPRLRRARPELLDANIHYDSRLFRAALVGLGGLGIIVSVVLEVDEQSGISQRVLRTTWSRVRPLLSEPSRRTGTLFTDATLGISHPPALRDGRAAEAHLSDLEIFLNPYRIGDDYSEGAVADRDCWVISKATAAEQRFDDPPEATPPPGRSTEEEFLHWGQWIFDPAGSVINEVSHGIANPAHQIFRRLLEHDWIGAGMDPGTRAFLDYVVRHAGRPGFDTLQLTRLVSAEHGGPGTVKDRVNEIIDGLRGNTAGYAPRYEVLDTYDYTQDPLPVLSVEIALTTEDDRHLRLLDELLSAFDQLIRSGQGTYFGGWSLRFTGRSWAYLSMQRHPADHPGAVFPPALEDDGDSVLSRRDQHPAVCHIELFALKEFQFPDFLKDGNMEGRSDLFMKTLEDVAHAHGAALHWGQLNRWTPHRLNVAFGFDVARWRRARTQLVRGGRGTTFSNALTERCNLEVNGRYVLAIPQPAGGPTLVGYDGLGNLNLATFSAPGSVQRHSNGLRGGQQFVGRICGRAVSPDEVEVYGWGKQGLLLSGRVADGHAHWRVMQEIPELAGHPALATGETASDPVCLPADGHTHLIWRNRLLFPGPGTPLAGDLLWLTFDGARWHVNPPVRLGDAAGLTNDLCGVALAGGTIRLFGLTVGQGARETPLISVTLNGPGAEPRIERLRFASGPEDPRFSEMAAGQLSACAYQLAFMLGESSAFFLNAVDLIVPALDGDLLVATLRRDTAAPPEVAWHRVTPEFPTAQRRWFRPPAWFRSGAGVEEQYQYWSDNRPRERFVCDLSAVANAGGGYDLVGRGIDGSILHGRRDVDGFTWMSLGDLFGDA